MARGKTKQARISKKYAHHLEAIAGILLDERGVKARAARRVASELGLKSFRNTYFDTWAGKTEWQAALEKAREEREIRHRTVGNVGGKRFLEWATVTLEGLRDRYDRTKAEAEAEGESADSLLKDLEGRILKLRDAARAEERHVTDQRVKEAMADCTTFAKMLIRELIECGLGEVPLKRLQEIAADPARFLRDCL